MLIHELKTWPVYFHAVRTGLKTFEFRKNDRAYARGDLLHLREFCPCLHCMGAKTLSCIGCGGRGHAGDGPNKDGYTGKELFCRVTYITDSAPGLPPGFVIMAIKRISKKEYAKIKNQA